MNMNRALCLLGLALVAGTTANCAEEKLTTTESRYETRAKHSRDGIGKFYMGREIAQVMGHQAADWLERPGREEEERTDLLVEALQIKPGEVVADIGAGSGYFSWRIARRVGKNGKIFAVDIQPEMLEILMKQMRKHDVAEIVQPILGTVQDPKLPPESADLIFLVDVYHELDFPYEMTQAMIAGLKPGGRLVFVEYRGEDPAVPIKLLHKMTVAQLTKEMSVQPLKFEQTLTMLPQQHIVIFRKTPAK
jgi:precorrin-6B methylase 2